MQEKDMEFAKAVALLAEKCGGRAYFVGGCVRDKLLSLDIKDIDIEVHGISAQKLEEILLSFGEVIYTGKSFGVYGVKGLGVDIALPRKESLKGLGHKDIEVCVDAEMGLFEAAKRRDLTINAMYEDVLTGKITDFFDGRRHLSQKKIVHVSDDTFSDDPLRVMRTAQFAARFCFTVHEKTVSLAKRADLSYLPRERVFEEVEKALMRAEKPSLFFEVLKDMHHLEYWFPELFALIDVKQSTRYHKEGDAFCHTMMVLDEGAKLKHKTQDPLAFMLSCLMHDYGKAVCTEEIKGDFHAYGHETLGLELIENALLRITSDKKIIRYVLTLCALHMKPFALASAKAKIKSTNRMFHSIDDKEALIMMAKADNLGKLPKDDSPEKEAFLYERLNIYNEYMARPHITAKDLIKSGIKPGKEIAYLLEFAEKLRLSGVDKASALKQTLSLKKETDKKL